LIWWLVSAVFGCPPHADGAREITSIIQFELFDEFGNLVGIRAGVDWDVFCQETPPLPPHLRRRPHLPRDEGCTPGYWKQDQHFDRGYQQVTSPNQTLESVFDAYAFGFDNTALAQALILEAVLGQRAAQILLRAACGAVEPAHPDVEYPRTPADVIAAVNAALASNDRTTMLNLASALDADNNLGCPLN
jgi:hypothetical protein